MFNAIGKCRQTLVCDAYSHHNYQEELFKHNNYKGEILQHRVINKVYSNICCQRNVKNSGFHNLDAKILYIIFSYLTKEELLSTVCKVCRCWSNAINNAKLWKSLKFKGKEISSTHMCNLLRKSKHLEKLYLNHINDPIIVIRQMCRCCKQIRDLTIKNCTLNLTTKIPNSVLRNILYCCSNLETLNLKGSQFSSSRFYEELANLPHLKSLNLSGNKYLSIENLLTVALNCRHLEDISITCIDHTKLRITDEDAIFFFNNLGKTLRRIEFDTMGLGISSFEAILMCQKLEKLYLYNAHFLSGNVLCKNMVKLKNLKELKLTQASNLAYNDFLYLCEKGLFNKLTVLDFYGCQKVTNEVMRAILQCCKFRLHHLGLQSCKSINDVNFIITNCLLLKYLNIAHTTYSEKHYLLDIPLYLQNLHTLVVDQTVQDDILNTLRKKMPNLKIKCFSSNFIQLSSIL